MPEPRDPSIAAPRRAHRSPTGLASEFASAAPRASRRPMPALAARTAAALVVASAAVAAAQAADCTHTSTGLVPLTQLGSGLYLGQFQGGLYPGGSNLAPPPHHQSARAQAVAIVPRLPSGQPSFGGSVVLLSIGMSNTTMEFCGNGPGSDCAPGSFMDQAAASPFVDHAHVIAVDGAAGGQTAPTWNEPTDANYDRVRDQELLPRGLSEAQVGAVWIKVADANPSVSLPAPNADAVQLSKDIAAIARAVRVRYPNCRIAFVSSRIYGGYASTTLNPEPYAYESGFAVKFAVTEQIAQEAGAAPSPGYGPLHIGADAPVLVWGPYLWADGLTPRGDGLVWECDDFQADGTHPGPEGVEKVGSLLLGHFLASPYAAPWFRAPKSADLDDSGLVDGADLAILLSGWGPCPGIGTCTADLDWDGFVGGSDLATLLAAWGS